MSKIIGFQLKDSAFEKWIDIYQKYKDICTLQEFLAYNIGIQKGILKSDFTPNEVKAFYKAHHH